MATASSAMNDHRILSPISQHPFSYPSPAAPGRTRRSLPRLRRRCPRRKIRLVVWRGGHDGVRRVDPAFVDEAPMGVREMDQIDGSRAGIGANTFELSLVFPRFFAY
jgi:hypothetical protein